MEPTEVEINKLETVEFLVDGPVARIFLNRPEVHNALNGTMIQELIAAFTAAAKNPTIRVVVLSGRGASFCAGADLNWMKEVVRYSYEENLHESAHLADLYETVYRSPLPVIAAVNGAAIGGGFGLAGVCDLLIGSSSASFRLSEVRVGLVPAVISPFLVRKFGENLMREMFFLGNRVTADRALALGIIHRLAQNETLDAEVAAVVRDLLAGSPDAIRTCKELLFRVPGMNLFEARSHCIETIARARVSPAGQEGMNAFLEKRQAAWVQTAGEVPGA